MHLVIDGNNVAWAAFFALGRAMGADTPERKARATLLGLTQTVIGMIARGGEPPGGLAQPGRLTGITIAFDEGRPLRRRSIYPAYQTGREGQASFMENEPHVLEGAAEFIEGALATLPIQVLRGTNTEADDLIAGLTMQERGPVRIASSDRDFLQLVDGRVSILSVVKKTVIDDANFAESVLPREKDGSVVLFPRERFVDYRSLIGDSSDDLAGVPGIGDLSAARLLAFDRVERYFEEPEAVRMALGKTNRRVEAAFADGTARDVLARNRELMDLRAAAQRYEDLEPYRRVGRWDRQGFEAWLEEIRAGRIDTAATVTAMDAIAEHLAARDEAGEARTG